MTCRLSIELHERSRIIGSMGQKMRKQILHIIIVCLLSFYLTGCIVGYKTFSVDEKHLAQPAASLENIKISCTSDGGSRICDSIQYVLRTKYHTLDVQTIGANEADRFKMHINHIGEKSKKGETWALISAFSLAIIPTVLSEDHLFRFTITSPSGESRTYDYQFTERTYSWLPLFAFMLFSPGYYEDISGLSIDSYLKKRTSMFEDSIIPRLMIDAGPFLLSQTANTMK
jgi:hypothetical protein